MTLFQLPDDPSCPVLNSRLVTGDMFPPKITLTNSFEQRIAHTPEKELPGNANWVVQKYGGTSLGKFPVQIVKDIIATSVANNRIAVVCSARSTQTKSEGTTNRLLRAAREAEKATSPHKYVDIVNLIRDDHIHAGRTTLKDAARLEAYEASVNDECDSLVKILDSCQLLTEVTNRAEDKIVARGERLSCLYMTALLLDHGIKATYIDLGQVLPLDAHDRSTLNREFYSRLSKKFASVVLECQGSVPVITGYFGHIPGGLLETIGRGYTDLCAALVAVGLRATELQIWKEVDGIFTADPRKVPLASIIDSITPSEAAELTFYGSEVLHPFTMDQVIRASIPIRIKNVKNPLIRGTVIWPDPAENEDRPSPSVRRALYTLGAQQKGSGPRRTSFSVGPKRPTAVTIKRSITVVNVQSKRRTRAQGFLMSVFSILDKYKLSVDLISSSEVNVSMALHSEVAMLSGAGPGSEEMMIESDALRGAFGELGAWGDVDLVPNMAIVSLVGKHLKSMIGISARFFTALSRERINIEMISQGASEINISCVINEDDADRALNVVHTSLFTFLD